jgi:hypothetical protein
MMTSAPSPRSNVTLTKVAAEKLFLGFPNGHFDAYTGSFAHSPARDCHEHLGIEPTATSSEHSDRNDLRYSGQHDAATAGTGPSVPSSTSSSGDECRTEILRNLKRVAFNLN